MKKSGSKQKGVGSHRGIRGAEMDDIDEDEHHPTRRHHHHYHHHHHHYNRGAHRVAAIHGIHGDNGASKVFNQQVSVDSVNGYDESVSNMRHAFFFMEMELYNKYLYII